MHGTTDMKTRKKATFLSDGQKWAVAKWCIENKCVIQDIHAYKEAQPSFIPFTLWRVTRKQAIEELYNEQGLKLTTHHLEQSVNFYNNICELTGSHPNVPAVQDTVEMDMLTAENKRLKNDIKEITDEFTKMKNTYNSILKKYGEMFTAMREIAKFVPAECFGVKKAPEPKIGKTL